MKTRKASLAMRPLSIGTCVPAEVLDVTREHQAVYFTETGVLCAITGRAGNKMSLNIARLLVATPKILNYLLRAKDALKEAREALNGNGDRVDACDSIHYTLLHLDELEREAGITEFRAATPAETTVQS